MCVLVVLQLSILSKRLDDLWEENAGEPILFIWFDFLEHESMSLLREYEKINKS